MDTTKAVLKRKFIAMSTLQKDLKLIPNSTSQTPRKTKQAKPKTSRRREIIKIRAKINEIETEKLHKESTKQKAGSLKK
jgi:hypothetical protein